MNAATEQALQLGSWRMQERQGELAGQVSVLEELDKGFSRTGVQSFALEGLLGELQVRLTAA